MKPAVLPRASLYFLGHHEGTCSHRVLRILFGARPANVDAMMRTTQMVTHRLQDVWLRMTFDRYVAPSPNRRRQRLIAARLLALNLHSRDSAGGMAMPITSCFLAALVAVLSAACSGGAVVVTPMGASLVAPVSVSVSQSPPARAAFVGYGCQVGSFVTTTFDVVVVASSPVNLDRLTVRLIDGSHVGGPMVTIPQAELTNQFGTVLILGGTRRVFTVHPRGACGSTPWRSVSAEVTVRDSVGATYVVAAHAPVS